MEITLSKNIESMRTKMSDRAIIKLIFEKVISTKPRRCFIDISNQILIKNYGITQRQNRWVKQNPIMTGLNRWQLISDARIYIDNQNNKLIYKIDITLKLLANISILLLSGITSFIFVYMGSRNILNALEISSICILLFIVVISISNLILYLRHKNLINELEYED